MSEMLQRTKKSKPGRLQRLAVFMLLGLAMLAAPPSAVAQSCALCYTQAASAGNRMIQALQSGILILIVPPTLMSGGMVFIVYRKRKQFRQDGAPLPDRDW